MEEIQQILLDPSGGAVNDLINQLCLRYDSIEQCQQLVENTEIPIAIRQKTCYLMLQIIDRVGYRWTDSYADSVHSWFIRLLSSNPDARNQLMAPLARAYGKLIAQRYNVDDIIKSALPEAMKTFFDQNATMRVAGLCCLSHILVAVDDDARNIIKFGQMLKRCAEEAGRSLAQAMDETVELTELQREGFIMHSLNILIKLLSINAENDTDCDVHTFFVDIDLLLREFFSEATLSTLITNIYMNSSDQVGSLCLDVMYRMVSISDQYRVPGTIDQVYIGYVRFLIAALKKPDAAEKIHKLCLLAYKLNMSWYRFVKNEGCMELYKLMDEVTSTYVTPEFFVQLPHTVIYIVKFWTCFTTVHTLRSQYGDGVAIEAVENFERRVVAVAGEFLQALKGALCSSFIDTMMCLDPGNECNLTDLKLFSDLAPAGQPQIFEMILGELQVAIDAYFTDHSFENDTILSLLLNILPHLFQLNVKDETSEYHSQILLAICDVLLRTGSEVGTFPTEHMLLERSILHVIKKMKFNKILVDPAVTVTQGNVLDKVGKTYQEIVCFLFDRVYHSLVSYQDNMVIFMACMDTIDTYFVENCSNILELPSWSRFVTCVDVNLAVVDDDARNRYLQLALKHTICRDDPISAANTTTIMTELDRRFSEQMATFDANEFVSLMNWLRVLFECPKTPKQYLPYFKWFASDKIAVLDTMCFGVLLNYPVPLNAFLLMWNEFSSSKGNRIIGEWKEMDPCEKQRRKYSADGLKLFKTSVKFVGCCIDELKKHTDVGFDVVVETVISMVKVMQTMFEANYVIFEVFQVYDDHICHNIIHAMFEFIGMCSLEVIGSFPALMLEYVKLMGALITSQLPVVVETGHLNHMLALLRFGLDVSTIDLWSKCITLLTKLLVEMRKRTVPVEDTSSIRQIIILLFERILNEQDFQITVTDYGHSASRERDEDHYRGIGGLIFCLLQYDSDALGEIRRRLDDVVPDEMRSTLMEYMDCAVEVVAMGDETREAMENNSEMLRRILERIQKFAAKYIPLYVNLFE